MMFRVLGTPTFSKIEVSLRRRMAVAECVLRPRLAWWWVAYRASSSELCRPWTVVGPPSSRAENCSLQGRGLYHISVLAPALAH